MSLNDFYHGITRRSLIKSAACSVLGISASGWLPKLAAAAEGKTNMSCILLWMSGGPSQMETLDHKPGHTNGGPTKAIATAVPGIHIAENLPGVAKQMKDIAILRGMKTREGDHGRATQLMMTGRRPDTGGIDFPSLGSVVAQRMIQNDVDLPPFVSVAPTRFAQTGAGFLGPKYSPLIVSGRSNDPNARANLTIENLQPADDSLVSLDERFRLLKMLQSQFAHEDLAAEAHVANYNSAMRMVKTKGGGAFELDKEPEALRDRYGRNRFGQGCLLARRLVERGVPFVEVGLADVPGAGNWDSHSDNFNQVEQLCEVLDPAWSTLMEDLRDRGMLETTMVVWMGEFGRTPVINDNGGRDHFPDAWSVALAGGKIRGGQVVGDSGKDGMEAKDRPTSAPDLFASVLAGLAVDPTGENYDGDRPIPLVEEGGKKVEALFA
ncbi:MAG: DUF1501 domain-containing protein [Pirellulales bacterium]|nr:DUF1501 domain-containing protein [Pirellulales bacterium]